MNSEQIKALDAGYLLPTYGRFDVCLTEGKGSRAKSPEGKSYLDFGSGIGVNSLGFCDDAWVSAVCAQAGRLQHTSNLYYTEPGERLAQKLCERTGLQKLFFANSGAEANEGAIKAARKYSRQKYGEGRSTILTLNNSFHGRTMATLTATGQEPLHKDFDPFLPGFRYIPANDTAGLAAALEADVCAVMFEPVQGEGGVVPLSDAYLQTLAGLCAERDILLIADEVQTGVGRTGSFLASHAAGIRPDIVTLAKGLGGGLPIGAFLLGQKCAGALCKGDHGSTFGMNPVVCAGANVVVDRLDDAFLGEVTRKGNVLKEALARLPGVTDVSGRGLMLGVGLAAPVTEVIAAALDKGLLCLAAKDRLRLLPPLTITDEDIQEGIAILTTILEELT